MPRDFKRPEPEPVSPSIITAKNACTWFIGSEYRQRQLWTRGALQWRQGALQQGSGLVLRAPPTLRRTHPRFQTGSLIRCSSALVVSSLRSASSMGTCWGQIVSPSPRRVLRTAVTVSVRVRHPRAHSIILNVMALLPNKKVELMIRGCFNVAPNTEFSPVLI